METPETNLARRLIARHGIEPPVPVKELALRYADVYESILPVDVDGICIDIKCVGRKPTIYINTGVGNERRRRFTLAHELGHVLLPGHLGLIVDRTDLHVDGIDWEYWALEAEANRFASELLMPSDWAATIVAKFDPVRATEEISDRAEVSWIAATLKVAGLLPPGFLWCACDGRGTVSNYGRSAGTRGVTPVRGQVWEIPQGHYEVIAEAKVGSTRYVWARSVEEIAISTRDISGDWKPLLTDVLSRYLEDSSSRSHYYQVINGVVSAASLKSEANLAPGAIALRCYRSFQAKAAYDRVIEILLLDDDFRTFLELRAHQLSQKRGWSR